MAVVVEREWVRTWIVAMFDVALGMLLVIIGILLLFIGGSVEYWMHQWYGYSTFDVRAIITIGYAIAIFVIIYGFKRIVDSILKAWTRTNVKSTY